LIYATFNYGIKITLPFWTWRCLRSARNACGCRRRRPFWAARRFSV